MPGGPGRRQSTLGVDRADRLHGQIRHTVSICPRQAKTSPTTSMGENQLVEHKFTFLPPLKTYTAIHIPIKKLVTTGHAVLGRELPVQAFRGAGGRISGCWYGSEHDPVLFGDLFHAFVRDLQGRVTKPFLTDIFALDVVDLMHARLVNALLHLVDHIERLFDCIKYSTVACDNEALQVTVNYFNWRCGPVAKVEPLVSVTSRPLLRNWHISLLDICEDFFLFRKECLELFICKAEALEGRGIEYMLPKLVKTGP